MRCSRGSADVRCAISVTLAVAAALAGCNPDAGDPDFEARVAEPAYPAGGPAVLFDEGHRNVHTARGRFRPLADLLRADGYRVVSHRGPFTARALAPHAVLVVATAQGPDEIGDRPAFGADEIDVVEGWVRGGGSLLLVTDHFPFGAAARELAARFGVATHGGLTEDPVHHEPGFDDASRLVFSRDNGLLDAGHPIVRGRHPGEAVRTVVTYTGQSIRGPEGAVRLLRLSDAAYDRPPRAEVEREGGDVRVHVTYGDAVPPVGNAQALALEIGRGRVVVIGEAAALTAQRNPDGSKFGMNLPGNDNRQLALNVLHWLSRLS
jgi:hypothetical protein